MACIHVGVALRACLPSLSSCPNPTESDRSRVSPRYFPIFLSLCFYLLITSRYLRRKTHTQKTACMGEHGSYSHTITSSTPKTNKQHTPDNKKEESQEKTRRNITKRPFLVPTLPTRDDQQGAAGGIITSKRIHGHQQQQKHQIAASSPTKFTVSYYYYRQSEEEEAGK